MKRWLREGLIPAVVGMGAAMLVGQAVRPWNFVGGSGAIVLVSDSCPYSHDVLRSIVAFEDVRVHVTPVSIDVDVEDRDEAFWSASCQLAIGKARMRAPWLHGLPEDWLCTQLAIDAAKVHDQYFVTVPAYLIEGSVADAEGLDQFMAARSLGRRGGVIVPIRQLENWRDSSSVRRSRDGHGGVRGSNVGL